MGAVSLAVIMSGSDGAQMLRRRIPDDGSVAVFADSDAWNALAEIRAARPRMLLLDATFAMTARGAALISAVRGTAELAEVGIRVVAREDIHLEGEADASPVAHLIKVSRQLEESGTRARPRFLVRGKIDVVINGHQAELIDLSATGAQVVAAVRLAPEQSVRLIISDEGARTLCRGTVAWCAAAPSDRAILYRAGITFRQADQQAIESLCLRHGRRL